MGIQYNPRIVTDGLVLALDAGNTKSYPGSGTTWTDISGRGNTGTLTNGPTYSSLKGGCIVFDGTNDYVDTGKTATQLGIYDADYTFDVWVYPTNLDSDKTMFGTDQVASRQGLHLVFRGGAIYQGHYGADFSAGSATLNAWNNISYTYVKSSGLASIYKNGVLQGSGTIGSFIGTTNILLGRWATQYYFIGNGSNYKIYNRTLTAQEVSQNFNALAPRFLSPIFDGSISFPFSSPVQAQSLGISAGTYYFQTGAMSTAQLLEYQPNYYESRPFCCVFRSTFASTATTNKIDLSIPMAGLLVQRDALDLRGAVYWSTPITYTTVLGSGNNTADSGTGYAGSNARRVMLGGAGGHGIYNTGQQQCNWGSSSGSIGAGFNGGCGSFPDGLIWGTGSGSYYYNDNSGTWSHWITWS